MIREKAHRLDPHLYSGCQAVAFTARIRAREDPFVEERLFYEMEEMLQEAATTYRSAAAVYLFMPDHAHFILMGDDNDGDVLSAAKRFKQRSGYWLSRNHSSARWQKDFYDHVLRRHEDLQRHVRYILNNPVRAGLVDKWQEYRFRGSMIYDLDNWTYL
jgi:putative transposase